MYPPTVATRVLEVRVQPGFEERRVNGVRMSIATVLQKACNPIFIPSGAPEMATERRIVDISGVSRSALRVKGALPITIHKTQPRMQHVTR